MINVMDIGSALNIIIGGIGGGIVDASVGGGGFIMLSAMLMSGIDPHAALGSYKITTFFGLFFGMWRFYKNGMLRVNDIPKWTMLVSAIASAIGTYFALISSSGVIQMVVPPLMTLLLIYKLIYRNYAVHADVHSKMTKGTFFLIFPFLLELYDGFLGPGIMTMWILAFTIILGTNLIEATGKVKIFIFMGNIGSLVVFLPSGVVDYQVAMYLMFGYIIGTEIGVQFVIRCGASFVNKLLIFMLLILSFNLWYRIIWIK